MTSNDYYKRTFMTQGIEYIKRWLTQHLILIYFEAKKLQIAALTVYKSY